LSNLTKTALNNVLINNEIANNGILFYILFGNTYITLQRNDEKLSYSSTDPHYTSYIQIWFCSIYYIYGGTSSIYEENNSYINIGFGIIH
jgi:hypothetical protein